jgi:hypothetical protein
MPNHTLPTPSLHRNRSNNTPPPLPLSSPSASSNIGPVAVGSHGLKTLTTKQASAWRPLSARLQLLTDLVGNTITHAHTDSDLPKYYCTALLCISHCTCTFSSVVLVFPKNISLSADFYYPRTQTHPLSIPSSITYTLPFATPATYGVGGTGGSLSTEGVMNFAKTTGAFTHSNAEVRDSARVRQCSLHGI